MEEVMVTGIVRMQVEGNDCQGESQDAGWRR